MDSLKTEILKIAEIFNVPGDLSEIKTITAGNINGTYRVDYNDNGKAVSYIFQKVNTYVFKKPEEIMSNIELVTAHISAKCTGDKQTLVFSKTADGKNYYVAPDNSFWRICNCIDSKSVDSCDSLDVMEAVGAAFGEFQNMLSDFDASKLYETIPDFHNTKKRIQTLYTHIDEDPCNRVKEADKEIEFIKKNEKLAFELTELLEAGEVPLRVTHNDTKINNILFSKVTDKPIAVIDLDTVMPGLAMHDYGDAVRFGCSTASEDEKNTDLVGINLDKFEAFSKGFIGETKSALTQKEIDTMVLGAITITIELAVRFLDDYLTGDKYFKTLYPEHNIVRTRCQLKLADDMLKNRDKMEEIIKNI